MTIGATGATGKLRNPWAVIGLSTVTFGIYSLYWQYATFKEMKAYSGRGIGGGLGLVFAIFVFLVNGLLMPFEVGDLYTADGQQPPVTWLTGFWIFLPLVGGIIWVVRVQGRLNDLWHSHGAVHA